MRKPAILLAATLAVVVSSGAAMADNKTPEKKDAASAPSAEPITDSWITTKVKSSLLADTTVSGTKIDVDTVNGVVFLTGKATSQGQVDQAKKIAGGIEGVSKVDASRLVVSAD